MRDGRHMEDGGEARADRERERAIVRSGIPRRCGRGCYGAARVWQEHAFVFLCGGGEAACRVRNSRRSERGTETRAVCDDVICSRQEVGTLNLRKIMLTPTTHLLLASSRTLIAPAFRCSLRRIRHRAARIPEDRPTRERAMKTLLDAEVCVVSAYCTQLSPVLTTSTHNRSLISRSARRTKVA